MPMPMRTEVTDAISHRGQEADDREQQMANFDTGLMTVWVSASQFSRAHVLKAAQAHGGTLDPSPEHQGCGWTSGFQTTANVSGGHLGVERNVLVLEEAIYIRSNGCMLTFNL